MIYITIDNLNVINGVYDGSRDYVHRVSGEPIEGAIQVPEGSIYIDEQQYDQATRVLIALLRSNPHSAIADEAWFWLGEARYLLGAFSEAVEAFETLLLYFVDSRLVPNAKLKLGLTQVELRQFEAARTTLNELLGEKVDDQIKLTAQKALGRVDAAGF